MRVLLITFLTLFLSTQPFYAGLFDSKEEKEKQKSQQNPEVDYITLAGVMLKDGHYERAEVLLDSVDTSNPEVDLSKLYTFKGLIKLKKGQFKLAVVNFNKAITVGNPEPLVYVYLAQAHYAQSDFKNTLVALTNAGNMIYEMPDLLGVKAQCHWQMNEKAHALSVLENADALYPEKPDFMMRIITYYIELGLFKETIENARNFLKRFNDRPMSYLVVGEALRRSQQFNEAVKVMEEGHKMFPANENLLASLAHSYMQSKRYLAAARLFEKATIFNNKYLKESIGLYRLGGNIWKARYLNAQVTKTKQKLKQWVEILLTEQKYEEVVAINRRLEKYGLLKDDKIRYAVAYSFFKTMNYSKAEELLKGIRSAKIFKNGVKLLKAIEVIRKKNSVTI